MTRHRFDPFSFIAGAVSVGIAVAVLAGAVRIELVDLRFAGPVLVLVLGLALLLGGGRDRALPVEAGAAEPEDRGSRAEPRDTQPDAAEAHTTEAHTAEAHTAEAHDTAPLEVERDVDVAPDPEPDR